MTTKFATRLATPDDNQNDKCTS